MIMLALLVLCGGTFLYQRWRKQQEDKNNPEKDKNVNDINNVPHPVSIICSLDKIIILIESLKRVDKIPGANVN